MTWVGAMPVPSPQVSSGKAAALNAGIAEVRTLLTRLVDTDGLQPLSPSHTVVPDSLGALPIQRRRWVRGSTLVAALAMAFKTVRWPLDISLSWCKACTPGVRASRRCSCC